MIGIDHVIVRLAKVFPCDFFDGRAGFAADGYEIPCNGWPYVGNLNLVFVYSIFTHWLLKFSFAICFEKLFIFRESFCHVPRRPRATRVLERRDSQAGGDCPQGTKFKRIGSCTDLGFRCS